MLSHLRFHRRAPSNPTSPLPDQWESAPAHDHPQTTQDVHPLPDSRPRDSNAANTPPTLPPITRVTSEPESISFEASTKDAVPPPVSTASQDVRSPPLARPAYGSGGHESSFIGGVALRNYQRTLQNGQPEAGFVAPSDTSALPGSAIVRAKPPPPPINTGVFDRPPPVPLKQAKASSFVPPTQLQGPPATVGKRPAGTRLATEPPPSQPTSAPDTQKAKKGLPFLKNPMSTLLNRRRAAAQSPPDLTPSPQPVIPAEPFHDPRIRGTRVHDFSAPRQRRIVTTDTPPTQYTSPAATTNDNTNQQQPPRPQDARDLPGYFQSPPAGPVSQTSLPQSTPSGSTSSDSQQQRVLSFSERQKRISAEQAATPEQKRKTSLELKPLPHQPVPPVPPKDTDQRSSATPSTRTASIKSKMSSGDGFSVRAKSNASMRQAMSRNVSLSGMSAKDGVISAVPRHMKSTSSRFSFDMIGAAKQEKLLEERHRQRAALEKQNEPEVSNSGRDSRYDDIDDFDYDAMMDDDGLEERIPGVNADAEDDDYLYGEEEIPMVGDDTIDEEEEIPMVGDFTIDEDEAALDPDNDQENFAGFVFQRSNPSSSLASPHTPGMLATPRDANGRVIGFAMTKDTSTPNLGQQTQTSPIDLADPNAEEKLRGSLAGLGIDAVSAGGNVMDTSKPLPPLGVPQQPKPKDELYYDGGLNDELAADELNFAHTEGGGEVDAVPFDESIFDDDDTDQYGRPIPGAFAQAQARRAAERLESLKRESDMTSRLSTQSVVSQSTAHTSISVSAAPSAPTQPLPEPEPVKEEQPAAAEDANLTRENSTSTFNIPDEASPEQTDQKRLSGDIQQMLQMSDGDALYQAALAHAAQKAAASGKFRRDSSPPPAPADLVVTSPTTASDPPLSGRSVAEGLATHANEDYYYDHDTYTQDMDDYDFDDDDIVAEANASALANDSDGFYGQEFGFYAGSSYQPQPQGHSGGSSSSAGGAGGGGSSALSAQNLWEYSSGGYFGPSGGLGRTASGRGLASREPNLTPITERSEYSNRNSIMSLGLPSAIGSDKFGGLMSPGLAELAMRADEGDMTLSALMRLRSKTFGGSQASLVSSSREGSPRPDLMGSLASPGSGGANPAAAVDGGVGQSLLGVHHHARKGSAFSLWSRDSDAGSGSGSPTMTSMNALFSLGPSPSHSATTSPIPYAPAYMPISPPPATAPLPISSLGGALASPCSPVLEDEMSAAAKRMSGSWGATPARRSLSLEERNSMSFNANGATTTLAASLSTGTTKRPVMGHRARGSTGSISYVKEGVDAPPGSTVG